MKGSETSAQPKEPTKPKGILKGSSSPPKQSKQQHQQRDEDERRRIMFEMDSGWSVSVSAKAEEALRRARAEEAERDRRSLLGVKNMKVTESRQVTID